MIGSSRSLFALAIVTMTAAIGCVGETSREEEPGEDEQALDQTEPEKTSIENKTIPSYADIENLGHYLAGL